MNMYVVKPVLRDMLPVLEELQYNALVQRLIFQKLIYLPKRTTLLIMLIEKSVNRVKVSSLHQKLTP